MVKILVYIDRKDKDGFVRLVKDKVAKIYAETEIDALLKDGRHLLSATTSEFVTGAFAATTSFTKLTTIFQKED